MPGAGVTAVNKTIKLILAPIASLRLTVLLFVLSMILIFVGTVAQKDMGNWEVVNSYFRSLWLMMPVGVAGLKVPFPGGYTLGGLMIVNLLAAHTVRFKFSVKRLGIIPIHAGLILLILGEIFTGVFAVEWLMTITEGESINYAEDVRQVELAIVDPSAEDYDQVVVVPESLLAASVNGGVIRDSKLPFHVQVLDWMPNSTLQGPQQAGMEKWRQNPAEHGLGRMMLAAPLSRVSGVEGAGGDKPAMYIRISKEGEDLGTWMCSLRFKDVVNEVRQPVVVDGKAYLIELRYVRDYKPYTITLLDFSHDKFVGTQIPKNFSSEVQLVDPTVGEDRTALIYMNHPLRHRALNARGETLYQSGYMGEQTTILQVVRNPSWLMPYIACGLVTLGLVTHFGVMLVRFVERSRR